MNWIRWLCAATCLFPVAVVIWIVFKEAIFFASRVGGGS